MIRYDVGHPVILQFLVINYVLILSIYLFVTKINVFFRTIPRTSTRICVFNGTWQLKLWREERRKGFN